MHVMQIIASDYFAKLRIYFLISVEELFLWPTISSQGGSWIILSLKVKTMTCKRGWVKSRKKKHFSPYQGPIKLIGGKIWTRLEPERYFFIRVPNFKFQSGWPHLWFTSRILFQVKWNSLSSLNWNSPLERIWDFLAIILHHFVHFRIQIWIFHFT